MIGERRESIVEILREQRSIEKARKESQAAAAAELPTLRQQVYDFIGRNARPLVIPGEFQAFQVQRGKYGTRLAPQKSFYDYVQIPKVDLRFAIQLGADEDPLRFRLYSQAYPLENEPTEGDELATIVLEVEEMPSYILTSYGGIVTISEQDTSRPLEIEDVGHIRQLLDLAETPDTKTTQVGFPEKLVLDEY